MTRMGGWYTCQASKCSRIRCSYPLPRSLRGEEERGYRLPTDYSRLSEAFALFLDQRAPHRTEGAEHATVPRLGAPQ